MRALVAGGAGYIGSITSRLLGEGGWDVTVLDNFEKGHRGAVVGLEVAEGDIRDAGFLEGVFRAGGFDAVLDFAAYTEVGESMREPLRYYRNNLGGGINLVEAAVRAGVKRFVFSSSAAVYGIPEQMPITEDAVPRPINPYGRAKLDMEAALEFARAAYGLSYASLRYFNAAGAHPDGTMGEDHRPESHLIPRVLKAALEGATVEVYGTDYPTPDGTCVRDYIHVVDLAGAHVLALEAMAGDDGRGEIFNLGNGEGFSVRQVIARASEVAGRDIDVAESPRRAGDPPVLVASAEKAGRVLGWKPRFDEIGIIMETAWRWHSAHPGGYQA